MKPSDSDKSPDLASILRLNDSRPHPKIPFMLGAAALIVIATGGGLFWYFKSSRQPAPSPYATELVKRGDISLTITATGNLEPTNEVTVGSELSGTVLEVYADINDKVVKGQPLAKLDTSKLAQQTEASRAAVTAAKAQVAQAAATVKESAAALARQQELHRLSGGKVPSQADLDTAIATADRAQADLASAQAAVAQAAAQVLINESDLSKAVIKSPIDGIVLTRSIEPGQTVAASFTAPELFVIAENLDHMKLDVAVAEADIGRVAKNQKATFTVDAWPSRSYAASVLKVSYGSAVTDNVVTYETELEVTNSDLSLRPGMTATADIHVAESNHVLLVPSAALRFNPATTTAAAPAAQKKSFVQSLTPMPPRQSAKPGKIPSAAKSAPGGASIWILQDGQPKSIPVTIGLSDERHTEISGQGLTEGLAVITHANLATP